LMRHSQESGRARKSKERLAFPPGLHAR
jgi:hypothetical protein